jgi:hypothetical protein
MGSYLLEQLLLMMLELSHHVGSRTGLALLSTVVSMDGFRAVARVGGGDVARVGVSRVNVQKVEAANIFPGTLVASWRYRHCPTSRPTTEGSTLICSH